MNDSLITQDRLNVISSSVKKTSHLEGDMAELGVYKGGSAKVICTANPNKTLRLFDTFTGQPYDDEIKGGHHKGDMVGNLEHVKNFLAGYNVIFHVGVFPDTTPLDTQYCFVHLDADLYQSTIAGIKYFWPRLILGGIMVFDDYEWRCCPGVKKAIDEELPNIKLNREAAMQCWIQENV